MERLPVEPTITDVMKASKFLRNRVRRTPAEYSFALSERAGAPVVLKLDNQQICGSFKVRGAFYKMFSLSRETLERGVVTCSSGNHAQGVAKAAAELRAKSWIYVPDVCPETKKTAIRRLGGEWVELVVANGDYDFAYLIRLLTGEDLPESVETFEAIRHIFFPHIFDVKYLSHEYNCLSTGLSRLAEFLNVRIEGRDEG